MKKQLLALLFASLVMSSGFASFKQKIQLCLDSSSNNTGYTFGGHFGSSDFFDPGHDTPVTSNAKGCVSHDYSKGPKNIYLKTWVNAPKGAVLLNPASSCAYLANYKSDPSVLASSYQATTAAKETWTLTFKPAPTQDKYKAVFNVECEQTSTS